MDVFEYQRGADDGDVEDDELDSEDLAHSSLNLDDPGGAYGMSSMHASSI